MSKRSVGVLICVGLLASLFTLPAVATEWKFWDSQADWQNGNWSRANTPSNCSSTAPDNCADNTGNGACWVYDTTTTPGAMYFNLQCAPTDTTQDYRIQYSATSGALSTIPYAKMQVTVSGVPAGELIKMVMGFQLGGGGNGWLRRGVWIGNGTSIVTEYLGNGTVVFDGTPPFSDTWTVTRLRFHLLTTTLTDWQNAWQNVHVNIDWIVVTDNPYYPDASAGAGGDITPNTIFAIEGRPVVLTAPSGSFHQWYNGVNPVYDDEHVHPSSSAPMDEPPTRIIGSLQQNLVINPVAAGDAGTYTCVYDDGSKSTMLSSSFDLVVYPAPEVGDPIVSNPGTDLIAAGYPLVLTAPSGSAYQWSEDGEVLTDSTSQALEFASLSALDAGTYTCVYDDGGTLKETPGFVLSVETPGEGGGITASGQPAWFGDTIVAGYPLILTAPSGVSFIWYKDGVPVEDSATVTGSNTQTLQFSPVSTSDLGTYTCVFDDGSHKALMQATFELLVLGTVPVAGIAGLALAAAALVALAARGMRRR